MKIMKIEQFDLNELIKRILSVCEAKKIILFGSSARGDTHKYSDIDVMVVVADGNHRRHTAQTIYKSLRGFQYPVDIIVATESDLISYADVPGYVYKEVLTDGRELYAA